MTVSAWLGASTFFGSGATGLTMRETCSTRLGWSQVNFGQGGTGYTNAGGVGEAIYGDRLASVFAVNPDVILIQGTINEIGTPAAVQTAVAQAMAAIVAWKPTTLIYHLGLIPVRHYLASTASYKDVNDAYRAGCAGYATFIDPLVDGWLTGTGTAGAPAGDGNADVYLGADTFHPTQAGHDYLGTRLAFAIRPPATGLSY